jgi:hypothetical protein
LFEESEDTVIQREQSLDTILPQWRSDPRLLGFAVLGIAALLVIIGTLI